MHRDERLRRLARQALSDPEIAEQLQREEARNQRKFVLRPDASERTKRRWIAHQLRRCNATCRFCRRGD